MSKFSDYLIEKGGVLESGRAISFGDDPKAFRALEDVAIVMPLLGTSALHVTGADRLEFVHGQVSNEVKRLDIGEFQNSLMLNHKGHALAQMRVLRREDDLLLFVEGGAGDFVRGQLEAHIIFDQVELEPLAMVTLSIQGVAAEKIFNDVLETDAPKGKGFLEAMFDKTKVISSPAKQSLQGGYNVSVEEDAASDLLEALIASGAALAGENTLDLARVIAGIPSAEGEGGEGILPQEAGLEPLVSYTKGCYLGQEIMARIEARGNLRRSLQGIKLDGEPESAEHDIHSEGKKVGRLGTVVNHPNLGAIALAVLRNDVSADTLLSVGGVSAKLKPLPFEMTPLPSN